MPDKEPPTAQRPEGRANRPAGSGSPKEAGWSEPVRTDAGARSVPEYVGIEITRRCNQTCPHCFTNSGPGEGPGMEPGRVRRLLLDLKRVGVRHVAFSGGEPLLRRDLESLIQFGLGSGLHGFGVVTNGAYVDDARAAALARAGLAIAQVSLDGVDAADYVAVRACAPGLYHQAVRAIGCYRKAGIRVDIACLLTGRNLERAPEMAALARDLGVVQLRYCSFVPTGRGGDVAIRQRFAPTAEQMDRFLDFMVELNSAPDRPLVVGIDHGIGPSTADGSFRCTSGVSVAYVSERGDLYPCPGSIFPEYRVGNVFERDVAELFNDPAMRRVSGIRKHDSQGACATCTNRRCSGGCRGLSFSIWGNALKSPPYCRVRRRGA